jgi:hypothetical protein
MVKKVLSKIGCYIDTALVVIGWTTFFSGILAKNPLLKVCLLGLARVLP